jgi:hypothetical protein
MPDLDRRKQTQQEINGLVRNVVVVMGKRPLASDHQKRVVNDMAHQSL